MISDIFLRALRHPIDYSGIVRTNDLILREHQELGDNIHTFVFEKPDGLIWKAGQHAIFTFPDRAITTGRLWRPFSIASSHHEGVVRIATIIPEPHSEFKEVLRTLRPGDNIRMHGPFGEFHAGRGGCTIVGVAGGIGITPFRALAYEIAHGHLPNQQLSLIFSAREVFAFKDHLDDWQNENLLVTYNHTPDEVNVALQAAQQTYKNDACYFISGSPGMIGALRKSCQDMGINKIVNDPFKGY